MSDRTFRITVLDMPSCEHLEYVFLTLPAWGEKGAYTQRVSFNAFFHGMKGRNRTPTRLYVERDDFEYAPHVGGIPHHSMTSLWDFYKHIGYNWKTKKHRV